ncbi:sensor histidine kinase [Actinobaculum suis]|uniref:Sensor-like histidine kinase SenX3 n=2 Tax=Actinobaculum suis TaxID=1657 RepID=A0AAW9HJ89_9ACTO|nr:ATP-binding protein [Actinobaculum suis]MDY5153706.1 ATP-binding protein [Actinobaculum suis]
MHGMLPAANLDLGVPPQMMMLLLIAALLGLAVGVTASLAYMHSQRTFKDGASARSVQAESELNASRILDTIPEFHILVGPADVVERASTQAYSFGIVKNGALDRPEFKQLAAEIRSTGEIVRKSLRIRRSVLKDQSDIRLALYGAPLSNGRVLILFEDNTKKIRVEETRRDFVANVSHELKTPVGAISLLAETIASAADDAVAVRHFAGQLNLEVERLRGLVMDMIELSRVQDKDALSVPELVEVDAVIAESVARMKVEAAERDVKIVTGGTPGLRVYGDRKMLATAIRNLLDNAVRYTRPHGRVSVATSLEENQVRIAVIDQGEGIPPELHERIFERFYRGDHARDRNSGGSGIGLAIVKHVVQDHGGHIRLWSKKGQGSTFTIVLPEPYIPDSTGPATAPATAVAAAPSTAAATGPGPNAAAPASVTATAGPAPAQLPQSRAGAPERAAQLPAGSRDKTANKIAPLAGSTTKTGATEAKETSRISNK